MVSNINSWYFIYSNRRAILAVVMTVSAVALVALAALCFPASFGVLGGWALAHGFSLAFLPLAAKVGLVAAPFLCVLGTVGVVIISRPIEKIPYSEVDVTGNSSRNVIDSMIWSVTEDFNLDESIINYEPLE